jgi:sortase B
MMEESNMKSKSDQTQEEKRKKKQPIGIYLAMCLAAIVFVVSLWQLGRILWNYHSANASYRGISQEMGEVEATLPAGEDLKLKVNPDSLSLAGAEEDDEEEEDEAEASSSTGTVTITVPDFEYLQSINSDVIGWIQIPGTVIDYPIVQGTDNEFYLTHTYTGQENSSGAIFMDTGISDGFDDKNPIIYGHNLKSGAMFSRLNRYTRASFWQQHRYIYITTPENGQMIYQVFSAYQTDPDAPVYYYGFGADEVFEEYIERVKSYSIYDAGISVTREDSIVTLSTCANNIQYRFVVHAKRIQ